MTSPSRYGYAIRILAALAFCLSLWWLAEVLRPWARLIDPSESDIENALFALFMPLGMGAPAFVGLYFGYQGMRKTDAETIKGLVASYCFGLVWGGAPLLSMALTDVKNETTLGLNEGDTAIFVLLPSVIIALAAYLVVSRRLLRLLGLHCPSIRQSMPAWPIGLITFLLLGAVVIAAKSVSPPGSPNVSVNGTDVDMGRLVLGVGILVAAAVYKLGIWLFVAQKTKGVPRPVPWTQVCMKVLAFFEAWQVYHPMRCLGWA